MFKVVVLGSGNVAHHLISVFKSTEGIDLVQVYARHPEALAKLLPGEKITSKISDLAMADLYIIAVSDGAINEIIPHLPFTERLVAHTSGSMPLQKDNGQRNGVFYPLQTFSKNKTIDFKSAPICLEAENEQDFVILKQLADAVSDNVYQIDSVQRRALHVAAVFCNNFTNHLYTVGSEICKENKIPFDILKPLIQETTDKIMYLSPLQAQTGPAIRGDETTINAHLDFLKDDTMKSIYELLTQSIQKAHVTELQRIDEQHYHIYF